MEIKNINELEDVAQWLLEEASTRGANIIALYGAMGSGKTTLTSEMCRLLDVVQTPSSPTFAIINGYTTVDGKNIYHFDFYRINKLEEAYDIGYEEYFYSDDLCIIEWPELVQDIMPAERTMAVDIEVTGNNTRKFTIR